MNILAEIDRAVLAGAIAVGTILIAWIPVLVAHNRHHPKRRWIYCLAVLSWIFTKVPVGSITEAWVTFTLSAVLWVIALLWATSVFAIYNRYPKPRKRTRR